MHHNIQLYNFVFPDFFLTGENTMLHPIFDGLQKASLSQRQQTIQKNSHVFMIFPLRELNAGNICFMTNFPDMFCKL